MLFLQNLRVTFGSSVVLEGVVLGSLFTVAVGVLTFALHQRLPYKKLLIITGGMLLVVLFVMVGEEVNEMQLAGWIGTTPIGISLPGWAGEWFSTVPERRDDRRAVSARCCSSSGPTWGRSICASGAHGAVTSGSRGSPRSRRSGRPERRGRARRRSGSATELAVRIVGPMPAGVRPVASPETRSGEAGSVGWDRR